MSEDQEISGTAHISKQLMAENARLPIDISNMALPTDMSIRSIALTLATRHCGDRTVKEGNLYQQLKMDNKLGGPLTTADVVRCALIFERFLWGEWSKDIAKEALTDALQEMEDALEKGLDGKIDDDPIRSHEGES